MITEPINVTLSRYEKENNQKPAYHGSYFDLLGVNVLDVVQSYATSNHNGENKFHIGDVVVAYDKETGSITTINCGDYYTPEEIIDAAKRMARVNHFKMGVVIDNANNCTIRVIEDFTMDPEVAVMNKLRSKYVIKDELLWTAN